LLIRLILFFGFYRNLNGASCIKILKVSFFIKSPPIFCFLNYTSFENLDSKKVFTSLFSSLLLRFIVLYFRIKVFASFFVFGRGYFTLGAGFISKMSNIYNDRSFSSIQVDTSNSFKFFFYFPTAPSMPLQTFETISFSTPLVVEITTSFLLFSLVVVYLLITEPDLL
jgi:hypothetical protein